MAMGHNCLFSVDGVREKLTLFMVPEPDPGCFRQLLVPELDLQIDWMAGAEVAGASGDEGCGIMDLEALDFFSCLEGLADW